MKHTIPEQFIGKKVNASRSVTLETNQEAADFFNIVRNRLLDIDNWYRTAKLPFSTLLAGKFVRPDGGIRSQDWRLY
ncbi:MAG: hypothetical protein ACTHZ1_11835 [Sphingobacterium sp.]